MRILKRLAVSVTPVILLAALLGGCATAALRGLPPALGEIESCPEVVREMKRTNTFCARSRLRSLLVRPTPRGNWDEVYAAWESVTFRRQALEETFAEQSCPLEKPEWECPKPCYKYDDGKVWFWGLDAEDACIITCETRRRDLAEP